MISQGAGVGDLRLEAFMHRPMEWLGRRAADVVLVLVGAIFVGVGLGLSYAQRPIDGGVVTLGRIVDQVTKTDSEGGRSTYPVIEFTDHRERTHRFENEIGGSGFGVEGKIGQVVKVRYDPSNPRRAQWVDQPGRWVPAAAMGLGAAVWLVELGLVARRLIRRRHQADPGAPTPLSGSSPAERPSPRPGKERPSRGTILTEPVIIVEQVWRGGAWPEYDLYDQNWARLGKAFRQRPRGLVKRMARLVLDSRMFPGPLHVVDPNGTVVFDVLLASEWGQVILVRDAEGNLLGKGIRTKSGFKPQFDLDIGGQFVGTMGIEDWRQRGGVVKDEWGREVAELRTITPETPYPVSPDSEGYYLKVREPLKEPLRRLVVACAIVLQAAVTSESIDSTFEITWSLPKRSRARNRAGRGSPSGRS